MNNEKEIISFRCDSDINTILGIMANELGTNKSLIINTAILDLLQNLKEDIYKKGLLRDLDLKKIAQHKQSQLLRGLCRIVTRDLVSRNLFISRLRSNVLKFLSHKRSKEDILELILSFEHEAKQYPNNEKLLKEIEEFKKFDKMTLSDYTRMAINWNIENKVNERENDIKIKNMINKVLDKNEKRIK